MKKLTLHQLNYCQSTHLSSTVTAIKLNNCTFTWESASDNKSRATLRNITLEVSHGEMVAVVGVVGSGKSSLMSALLGDMMKVSGTAAVSVSVKSTYRICPLLVGWYTFLWYLSPWYPFKVVYFF